MVGDVCRKPIDQQDGVSRHHPAHAYDLDKEAVVKKIRPVLTSNYAATGLLMGI